MHNMKGTHKSSSVDDPCGPCGRKYCTQGQDWGAFGCLAMGPPWCPLDTEGHPAKRWKDDKDDNVAGSHN